MKMGGSIATGLEWWLSFGLFEERNEDFYECIVTIHSNDLAYQWIIPNFMKKERRKDSMRHCEYANDSFSCSQNQEDRELNDRILVDGMSHLRIGLLGMLRLLRLRACHKNLVLPTLCVQGRTVLSQWGLIGSSYGTPCRCQEITSALFSIFCAPCRYLTCSQVKLAFLGQTSFSYAHNKCCFL